MQLDKILQTVKEAKASAEKVAKNNQDLIASSMEVIKSISDKVKPEQEKTINEMLKTLDGLKDINNSVDIEALTKKAEKWKNDLN